MRDAARIQAAVEILEKLFAFDGNEETTVYDYFRSHRYIGCGDRHAVAQTVWDVARCFGRLSSLDAALTARKAVAAFLLYSGTSPILLEKIFSGEKYAPAVFDDNERAFLTALPAQIPSARFEAPAFLQDAVSLETLTAMTVPAPLDLRVNTLQTTRDKVLDTLKIQGIRAEKTPLSPLGVRVFDRPNLKENALFKNGAVDIQDEGSQLAALLCEASANETVVDWCAGAGGKTLALAAAMNNAGRIDAVDFYPHRMKDLPERLNRAGIKNVRVLTSHADADEEYDLVLIDAPCSGSGTWRRSPLLRWRTTAESVSEVARVQASILRRALPHVKKGGRLVYVTCSLLDAENKKQIEALTAEFPHFELNDLSVVFKKLTGVDKKTKTISLRPDADNTDGFFVASLTRKA